MCRVAAALTACAVLGAARAARAAENDWTAISRTKAQRRSDFTLGLSVGPLMASAYGYPNKAGKIGDDRYVADPVSVSAAWPVTLARRCAPRLVHVWRRLHSFSLHQEQREDVRGRNFIFRIETFPLWATVAVGETRGPTPASASAERRWKRAGTPWETAVP